MTERAYTQFVYTRPIDLSSNSTGCIAMTCNPRPVQRSASKHVDPADHYARAEQQERGTITISFVGTKDLITDAL